jgi:outer membrane protein OmpA-like peptidoglycan-associated protein
MKKLLVILFVTGMFLGVIAPCYGQIEDPKKKTEEEAEERVDKKVDKGIDKGLDKIEEGLGGLFKKKKKKEKKEEVQPEQQKETVQTNVAKTSESMPKDQLSSELVWSKYDFVPGDKIIFEDNLEGEENGEFPSRWDLVAGNVENARFGGENVIMFRGAHPTIIPYLKNSETDYLPEIFTVEFDLYLPNNYFKVLLYDRKNQRAPSGATYLDINRNSMSLRPAKSSLPDNGDISNRWAHIAIAYTKGKMKAYIDETRLINIPRLGFDPTGLSLHAYHASDNNRYYIKNFRIAEGGVKYYDRFLQDGKIVSTGIRFDTGKSTLKPESMGVINEIYEILNDHPEVKFTIVGYTDSDGDPDLNQKLSEARAKAVQDRLVSMGIDASRLSFKGFGETKPVASNDTSEGKAENRRVEFVKM